MGADRRLHHVTALVDLTDHPVGVEAVVERGHAPCPFLGPILAALVGQHVAVAVLAKTDADDACLVRSGAGRHCGINGNHDPHHLHRPVAAGLERGPLDELPAPERALVVADVFAEQEAFLLPLGQAFQVGKVVAGQVGPVVVWVDDGIGVLFLVDRNVVLRLHPLDPEAIGPVHPRRRVQVHIEPLRQVCAVQRLANLRQAGSNQQVRRILDFRGFVLVDGRIFVAEDALHRLVVVDPADPDLRVVGEKEVALLILPLRHRRVGMADRPDLRERVPHDGALGRRALFPQDQVPRFRRIERTVLNAFDQQCGLARPRASVEQAEALARLQGFVQGALLPWVRGEGHSLRTSAPR